MPEKAATILIVEDEQIVAVDIESQLTRLGYGVVGMAASGEEACRKADQLGPDLVLMDVRIDGPIDGIEAARRIRQSHESPVVFLTAYTDVQTLERAKLVEPYGYVVKPFDPRDLDATIRVALHKAAVDRRLRESHDNLRAILDAQRSGAVMLDANGRIHFASRAALRIAEAARGKALDGAGVGGRLTDLLPLSDRQAAALEAMWLQPAQDRGKVPVVFSGDGPRPQHVEIEVVDDPRGDGRRLLFLYDVSPLFDLRRQLDDRAAFHKILGKSSAMRQVFQAIQEVSRVDSTVLITGETGVGKELVARTIHDLGARQGGPFVALNCAGLNDELAASQLFGHRRGSFTGAVDDQTGLFEAANGGTLFLDEIGELSPRVQTTLLRVLEEKAVLPLGASSLRPVKVRVIAATHRDLVQEAAENRFRQDLLYRVRVGRIHVPPLRNRREDVPILARAFLADHRASTGKTVDVISDDAMAILMDYRWPGNVRELRNALEFAVIHCRGSIVQPQDLPPELIELPSGPELQGEYVDEKDRIVAALKRARGNRTTAATLLGISRATLYRRLRELGIDDA